MSSTQILAPNEDDIANADAKPLLELQRLSGGACTDCRCKYSSRDIVFSIVLGFKNAPRCLPCLSRRLGRNKHELAEQLIAHIHRRDCFLAAWREAERRDSTLPCESELPMTHEPLFPHEVVPSVSTEWDAGDMGCGELVMALRLRMNDLPAGSVLKVTATDPAAPEDLPAWCRMIGHTLVAMHHPIYYIRRKGD